LWILSVLNRGSKWYNVFKRSILIHPLSSTLSLIFALLISRYFISTTTGSVSACTGVITIVQCFELLYSWSNLGKIEIHSWEPHAVNFLSNISHKYIIILFRIINKFTIPIIRINFIFASWTFKLKIGTSFRILFHAIFILVITNLYQKTKKKLTYNNNYKLLF